MNPEQIKSFVQTMDDSAIAYILVNRYVCNKEEINALSTSAKASLLNYYMLYTPPCSKPEPDNICDPFFTFKDEVTT